MLTDELLAYLFDAQPHPLAAAVGTWLAASRRFAAFATDFRPKIRKKIRTTQEMESLLDLQLELETAYLLLRERLFSVVYEPQREGKSRSAAEGQARGPDFAVTFTTSTVFMLEVTRLRTVGGSPEGISEARGLADAVCSKLGQLPPRRSNVLLAGAEIPQLSQEALRAAMLDLQQRAERGERAVLQQYRFRDRAEFFRYFLRLSELIVRGPGGSLTGWVNPQAKYPLPTRVRTALYRSLSL